MNNMLILKRLSLVALAASVLTAACSGTALPTATTTVSEPAASDATVNATAGASCATGDGVNDACACDADAHSSCAGFYAADWESYARLNGYTTASWKYGLLDCLGKHTVTNACRKSLDRREALNEQMMAACATYCRGSSPQPGAEPCVDQLKSLYDSLDNSCRVALDAHEAAKAVGARSPF